MAFMRRRPAEKEFDVEESIVETMSGPPVSTQHEAVTIQPENEPVQNMAIAGNQSPSGPPLPESGLPEGWTEEQWAYYGQQYLDGTL